MSLLPNGNGSEASPADTILKCGITAKGCGKHQSWNGNLYFMNCVEGYNCVDLLLYSATCTILHLHYCLCSRLGLRLRFPNVMILSIHLLL